MTPKLSWQYVGDGTIKEAATIQFDEIDGVDRGCGGNVIKT